MSRPALILAATAAAAGLAASASAQPEPQRQCFYTTQIRSTQPVGDRQVNVLVNLRDVYRIDLADRCENLRSPQRVLSITSPSGTAICGPAEARVAVLVDGFRQECFVDRITKLTPDQVAALPKRDRP